MTTEHSIFDLLAYSYDMQSIEKSINDFINSGLDIEIRNKDRDTLLSLSCSLGYLNIVKSLLQKGANPNIHNIFGRSPLTSAVFYNHYHIIEELLNHTPTLINKLDNLGYTPLTTACIKGNLKLIKLLVEHNADINLFHSDKNSALILTVQKNFDCFNYLINSGADPNVYNQRIESPLHLAYGFEFSSQAIKALFFAGANINCQDEDHNTPLHNFVYFKSLESIQTLLFFEPDITIKNRKGHTVLDTAKIGEDSEIISIIESYVTYKNLSFTKTLETPINSKKIKI